MLWQEDGPPPPENGALCLSTPQHNGKSGTGSNKYRKTYITMTKRKRTKMQAMFDKKTTLKTKDLATRTSLKYGCELGAQEG